MSENYKVATNKLKEVDSKILFAVCYNPECAKEYFYQLYTLEEPFKLPQLAIFNNFDHKFQFFSGKDWREETIADFIVKSSVPYLVEYDEKYLHHMIGIQTTCVMIIFRENDLKFEDTS